jgi:hypothetical protein
MRLLDGGKLSRLYIAIQSGSRRILKLPRCSSANRLVSIGCGATAIRPGRAPLPLTCRISCRLKRSTAAPAGSRLS